MKNSDARKPVRETTSAAKPAAPEAPAVVPVEDKDYLNLGGPRIRKAGVGFFHIRKDRVEVSVDGDRMAFSVEGDYYVPTAIAITPANMEKLTAFLATLI